MMTAFFIKKIVLSIVRMVSKLAIQAAELIVSLIREEEVDYPIVIQPQLSHRN
ncbi:hypothetical protein [Paenibacillus sp. J45TS6]|uniref:hypothetical protein n=1 Tax=Paenibacillus sp. J45TS6 TaxID=2807196 RepID=UPI001BCA6D29|nr:hypothetical protein [Paenibacillus sp. J45TS6]